jgi:drug/metabolite transporter (DMT)-like permease
LALLAGALIVTRATLGPVRRKNVWILALVGVLNDAANVLFSVASTLGLLAVVSVLSALYPIVTAALARVVLGERLSGLQLIGAGIALVGVVFITLD